MKTKQFIKEVEEMGFKVYQFETEILVSDPITRHGKANISKQRKMVLNINTDFYALIKLCLEYAETPIEEREEEKKYIVILPDPRNDGEYRYALCKRHDGIGIGHVHRSGYSKLTESEIKRNHSYLWQFAKEI